MTNLNLSPNSAKRLVSLTSLYPAASDEQRIGFVLAELDTLTSEIRQVHRNGYDGSAENFAQELLTAIDILISNAGTRAMEDDFEDNTDDF